jgi:hypothetical protein
LPAPARLTTAALNEYLKKLFYQAGYHVVQLSSPTSYDFMSAASRFATPASANTMPKTCTTSCRRCAHSRPTCRSPTIYLSGYSLGALDAAFVSHLDETRKSFNFKKVLMLNPPVNLYTSISNLDKLVQTEVKGINNSTTFYELVLNKLTRYFKQKGYVDLNAALVYDIQNSKERPDQRTNGDADRHYVPLFVSRYRVHLRPDQPSRPDHPAKLPDHRRHQPHAVPQALAAVRLRLLPDRASHPHVARPHRWRQLLQLIDQVSLYALKDYLQNSPKIAVMHNADDIILGPGDLGLSA